jgi:hypothetical protein
MINPSSTKVGLRLVSVNSNKKTRLPSVPWG